MTGTGYDLTAWPLFRSVLDDPRKAEGRTRRCLFLSPLEDPNPDIRRHAETVWKYVVRPALIDTDLSPRRFEAGEALGGVPQTIVDAILDDDLVLACLSFRDPNVFYGLAIAQASARPLIVLAEEGQDIGFEPRGAKVVTYSLDPDSMFSGVNVKKLQAAIASFGEDTIFEQPFRIGASSLNGGGNGGATIFERSRQFSWERRLAMVREAKIRIDIMGIANLAFTLHPDSVEVIRSRAGSGVEIRMLQCSPANPGLVSLLGQRDQQHLNAVKNEIEAAAEAWRRICDLPDLDLAITVRRAQTTIPLASALITDQAAVATPYLSSRITGESPTLHALADSGFHRTIAKEFDQVWSEAATLFRAEPRSSPRHQVPANGNALRPGEANRHFTNEPPASAPQGGLMRSFSNLRNGG